MNEKCLLLLSLVTLTEKKFFSVAMLNNFQGYIVFCKIYTPVFLAGKPCPLNPQLPLCTLRIDSISYADCRPCPGLSH